MGIFSENETKKKHILWASEAGSLFIFPCVTRFGVVMTPFIKTMIIILR